MASTVVESSPQKNKAKTRQNYQNSQLQISANQPKQTTHREVTTLAQLWDRTGWGGEAAQATSHKLTRKSGGAEGGVGALCLQVVKLIKTKKTHSSDSWGL